MQEKKVKIIKASITLFAEKGFHVTSVQEIVDQANVAKGSFYNYFTSKNDLIRAIYDYYYAVLGEAMVEKNVQTDCPRESFKSQLAVFFDFFLKHKPLIKMIMREQVPIEQDMDGFITEIKQQNYDWLQQNVKSMYDDEIDPYLLDILVMIDGILQGYTNWLMVDEDSIDVEKLPEFILRRLDEMCEQMIKNQERTPIKRTPDFMEDQTIIITKIRQKVLSKMTKYQSKVLKALDALDKEIHKDEVEPIVLDSLLMNLEQYNELRSEVKQLRQKLNV
ncbi:TetR/AcrR family transcriptional regulator [Alkalibacillus silvisoli]|uniref:TetR/AcrR family transcriptional regulator n=1 Tax=Alkalibacillus silvisoli TaxID=392823 RepID=A0ABP3K340_9BACI